MSNQPTVDILGDEVLTKQIIEGTLSGEFYDNVIDVFPNQGGCHAFGYFPNLTKVCLPQIAQLPCNCFSHSGIVSVDFSEDFPLVSSISISSGLFSNCVHLTHVVLPQGANLPSSCFSGCYNLESVSFIGNVSGKPTNQCFAYCNKMQTLDLHDVEINVGDYNLTQNMSWFFGMSGLEQYHITIPVLSGNIDAYYPVGTYCTASEIRLSGVSEINSNYFFYRIEGHGTKAIIFDNLNNVVPSLQGVYLASESNGYEDNIWGQLTKAKVPKQITENEDGASTKIYVPDNMVNDFKEATNWSLVSDYIFPISNYNGFLDENLYITDTWEEINESILDGTYQEKYTLGQIKRIYTIFGKMDFVYDGTLKDECENGEYAKMSFSLYTFPNYTYIQLDDAQYQFSGDYSSYNYIKDKLTNLYNYFPAELKPLIKTVKKDTYRNWDDTKVISEDTFKIYYRSREELGFKTINANLVFDLYQTTNPNRSRYQIRKPFSSTSATTMLVRNTYNNGNGMTSMSYSNGSYSTSYVWGSCSAVLAFSI